MVAFLNGLSRQVMHHLRMRRSLNLPGTNGEMECLVSACLVYKMQV